MKYLNALNVVHYLANTPQITFEITERCNLSCIYCGYGKLYNNKDPRSNRDLPIADAISFLNYIKGLWDNGYDTKLETDIHISFYGGEPLLNMPFIRNIIEYIENNMTGYGKTYLFSMTTNAVLLPKYMDFLVEKDFHILISLDGDYDGDSLRVFQDGTPSFPYVTRSIETLRSTYPDYFKSNVSFNSVLSSRTTAKQISNYIFNTYQKIPSISEINNVGINFAEIKLFESLYVQVSSCEESISNHSGDDDYRFHPEFERIARYVLNHSQYVYHDYNELLYNTQKCRNTIPTGTCLPFVKKVFVTVSGNIMPCERIGYKYILGKIDNGKVCLDYDAIAQKYNEYYYKINRTCAKCANRVGCLTCMFNNGQLDSPNAECNFFMTQQDNIDIRNEVASFFENYPEAYSYIMNNYEVH